MTDNQVSFIVSNYTRSAQEDINRAILVVSKDMVAIRDYIYRLEDKNKHLNERLEYERNHINYINRLEVDNHRLRADVRNIKNGLSAMTDKYNDAMDIVKVLRAENARLQNTLDDVLDRQPILVARAEKYAVEEFADMITDRASAVQVGNVSWVWQISQDDIDELVKEKVGENYAK